MSEEVKFASDDGRSVYSSLSVGNDEVIGSINAEMSVMIPGWIIANANLSDRAVRLWGFMKGALTGALTVPGTTHRSLALLLDVSERTAREAVYELRDAGALEVVPRYVDGRQMGNRYYLWPATSAGVAADCQGGGSTLPPVYKNMITNISNNSNEQSEVPAKRSRVDYSPDFEALWEIYPRRLNKSNSYKAWRRTIRRGASLDELINSVRNYAEACKGKDEQYIMHGSTFFGPGERWRDYSASGASEASVEMIADPVALESATIYDSYDELGFWIDSQGEKRLDSPGRNGYARPRNKEGHMVDASGTPYELDAQGKRRPVGYWN